MASDPDQAALAAHLHEWQLLAVDFEDTGSVASFECLDCRRIEFRAP